MTSHTEATTASTASMAPSRRTVTIVAQDPSVTEAGSLNPLTVAVTLVDDPIRPGPRGERFHVIDFDAGTGAVVRPARVRSRSRQRDIRPIGSGLALVSEPHGAALLADPAFHADNVYATCASLLGTFERVLGRRMAWNFAGHQLYLVPHAFIGANAGYSPDDRCIAFGYLPASASHPALYTCLSRDIIAHELTHALLDGLRPRFIEPGLPDQLAFHEGFADVVALLSVFEFAEIVARALDLRAERPLDPADAPGGTPRYVPERAIEAEALKHNILFGVGEQLGRSIDPRRRALRSSLLEVDSGDGWRRDPVFEAPHRRGEVLVAAVCHAVAELWSARLHDIARYGKVPLRRAAEEGAKVAGHVLGMCIRALDYLPPVDADFGDVLDAILAADEAVAPLDDRHYRDVVRASFARYDIAPSPRSSLAAANLAHPWRHEGINLRALGASTDEVFRFLWRNAANFGLDLDLHLRVDRVVSTTRTGPDGLVVEEIIADYSQLVTAPLADLPPAVRTGVQAAPHTEVQLWGGGVIVFDQFGRPRHHVAKHILGSPADLERQHRRLDHLARHAIFDARGRLGFSTAQRDTASFQALHRDDPLAEQRW